MKIGINGLGRIGKLSLWHHVSRQFFSEIVVNLGRNVGSGIESIASSIEKDSTYGRLSMYLHGHKGGRMIENLDEARGSMTINGVPVTFLRKARNPKDIDWQGNQVRLVVDSTGAFKDPTADPAEGRGAVRGHLQAGAEKVIVSAPFKIQAKGLDMPEDALTTVMGINDDDYDPARHNIVSAASCTTTCLSYMIKPLLDHFGAGKMLSASMVTVHAATGSQEVLDRLPGAGATDLRKNRSILNNIILTTTGSLIVLVLNLQDELENPIKRSLLNSIYEEYATTSPYLIYSTEQNVSSDIIGIPRAAVTIESTETHTRTATIKVDLQSLKNFRFEAGSTPPVLEVPITQAVIYGWYDNELGSYTNMLGELTTSIAERMV